jgi:hypothetical protein
MEALMRELEAVSASVTATQIRDAEELMRLLMHIEPEVDAPELAQRVARGMGWSPSQLGMFLIHLRHKGVVG